MKTGDIFFKLLASFLGLVVSVSVYAQMDEESVGRAAAAKILGTAPLVASRASQNYVNLLGSGLASLSGAKYKWRIGVVRSEAVNAFAMPGGLILITSGLIHLLENEDELAFVVAHEIAHVAKRHHYQIVLRQRMAEQAARGLTAVTKDGDTALLAEASGQLYARGLDKTAEFEADRLGVEIMTQAGYDPVSAVEVLEKLQRFRADDPRAELLFSTHPSPTERLDMLFSSGIDKLPRPSAAKNSQRVNRFQSFKNSI